MSKKTKITDKNVTADVVAAALSNPHGIAMQNTPKVREAVALGMRAIIAKLHTEQNNQKSI